MILCVVFLLLLSADEGFLQASTGTQDTSSNVTTTTQITSKPSAHNLGSTTSPSNTASLTSHSSTTTSTYDRSSSDTTASEHTSQTSPQHRTSTTTEQTTQKAVTKTNQTTSQSTLHPQKSTNESAFPTAQNNTTSSTALENKGEKDVAINPGLIAVLCVFFITLAVLLMIVIVKVIRARRPQFERLDDVPMGKISEDAPFARYPPK